MDILTLIFSVLTLAISVVCLYFALTISKRTSSSNAEERNTKKLDELRESMYNEFSRNRSEQNQSAQAQRQELELKITEINKSLEKLNTTNQEQLVRILREVSVGLATIREKNT